MNQDPYVLLFNGAPGVGKTTLAKEFAKRSKRSVFIDVDMVRHFVVGGLEYATNPNKDKKEFERQRLLAVDNVSCLTRNYTENGFNCFIADIAKLPSVLQRYEKRFRDFNFFHIFLNANIDEIVERDAHRHEQTIPCGKEIVIHIHNDLLSLQYPHWTVIDTSHKSIDDSVQYIIDKLQIAT